MEDTMATDMDMDIMAARNVRLTLLLLLPLMLHLLLMLSMQVITDMLILMPTGVMDFPFLPNLLKNPQLLKPERNARLRLIPKLGIMVIMAMVSDTMDMDMADTTDIPTTDTDITDK